MNIIITVCVRGGSKGIPGKNIRLINEKPLIYYTLKLAQKFSERHQNCPIYLSTDSETIKEVVRKLNFSNVNIDYTRPAELATDSSGKMAAIKDVKNFAEKQLEKKFDILIDMDVTSPLRSLEDVGEALTKLNNNKEALNLFSVSPANRNPYFNMVEEKEDGFVKLCKEGNFLTRQSAPRVYDMNASFYIFKKSYFENDFNSAITDKALIYNVPHVCFDLDENIDFEFMEYLILHNKLNFDFII